MGKQQKANITREAGRLGATGRLVRPPTFLVEDK
jgi:hypothetical protein